MSEYGQINETTKRWQLIQNTIKNNKFKTIVEIGTWKGLGSTLAVLKSKDDDTDFFSLESNLDFYSVAKKNLESYNDKVKLLYGRIIEISEVENFVNENSLTSEQLRWLESDIKDFKNSPNVLNNLPDNIDFLILDGGEFSTYPEWGKLKDRSKFVALDDINVLKCNRIYRELSSNSNYTLINSVDEGNGFCIFRRND
jgi:hypothetical protein